ncbi:MAG: peptidylprolyl isomerase [Propionibacteriaceae bacterium]|nr:peptidylprolyl isomerase [Propionibacteriaceae bacterium]
MKTSRFLLPIGAALLALGLAACSGDDTNGASDDTTSETTAVAVETTDPPAPGMANCAYVEGGTAARPVSLPATTDVPATGTVTATLSTAEGDLVMTLDRAKAPCTVNSFVSLSEQGYYNETNCHRLTTTGIFVLQCGDPTGTGRGGPGYSYADETSPDDTYGPGTVAMANAGANTNGSQFFIVYEDSPLSPDYTVFGQMDPASLEIVQAVASAGNDGSNGEGDGLPLRPVVINSVTIQ